jgi:hypothetical protein
MMRSPRGLLAACAFLLVVPLALANQVVFGVEAEITVHFMAAVGFALLALCVFDFDTPRWITWMGCLAASAQSVIYLLQGVSNVVSNDALRYLAFQVLGQQIERVLPDVLLVSFVGLLVADSQNKTRILGCTILAPVVGLELLSYGLSFFGVAMYETTPALRLVMLVPFIWLAFESAKKLAGPASASTSLKPSAVSA